MLSVVSIVALVATVSLIVTEILLIRAIRLVVRELQVMRRETPRYLGGSAALTLLVAGLAAWQAKRPAGVAHPGPIP